MFSLSPADSRSVYSAAAETPFSLRMKVNLQIGSASVVLDAKQGVQVIRSGMEGLHTSLFVFPKTRRLDLSVVSMGVVSPEGHFIRVGAPLHSSPSTESLHGKLFHIIYKSFLGSVCARKVVGCNVGSSWKVVRKYRVLEGLHSREIFECCCSGFNAQSER